MRIPIAVLLLVTLAGAVAACSGDDSAKASAATPTTQASGVTCGTVQVPAHEGVDVVATGLGCKAARDVVMGAAGKGRAAYDTEGFSCSPSDAPGGDTFYVCSGTDGQRLTFRYGTA